MQFEQQLFYYTNIYTAHNKRGVVQLPSRAWLVASGRASVAHPAAIADSVEEAAVASVTGVAAGQRVTQTGLLVRDAAPRGAHGPALQLLRRRILTTGSAQTETGNR